MNFLLKYPTKILLTAKTVLFRDYPLSEGQIEVTVYVKKAIWKSYREDAEKIMF